MANLSEGSAVEPLGYTFTVMPNEKKPFADPLVRQRTFPEPSQVFEFVPVDLKTALKEGLVAVDTNVLLIPYMTGPASLEEIRRTYARLTSENRLRIPGQVAREFADNRAEKLKTLFQQLSQKQSLSLRPGRYPLLEGVEPYTELLKCEKALADALERYRGLIQQVLEKVQSWNWDDPVSKIYRDHFVDSIVIDPTIERDSLLSDHKYRQDHRIPPGYKDASNEYSGIGDLLIWRALLQIGAQEKQHLVFVSGDEKSDWRYQSDGRALYPRFELVDEYRRASDGKSLLIISFAELLAALEVPEMVVAEVKQEEQDAALESVQRAFEDSLKVRNPSNSEREESVRAEQAVLQWLCTRYGPNAVSSIAYGPIDFFVAAPNGPEGYKVIHLRESDDFRHRFEKAVLGIRNMKGAIPIRTVLVFVASSINDAMRIRHFPYISPGPISLEDNNIHILTGILSRSGHFQPIDVASGTNKR